MPTSPAKHKVTKAKVPRHGRDEAKRNRERALPTNSAIWRAIRAGVLSREPLCRVCREQGRITAATEVDHIDGDSANGLTINLQPLCTPCHSRKTAHENHERKRW